MDKDRGGKDGDGSENSRRGSVVKGAPAGILRVDSGKLRRTSLDHKYLSQIEPTSPQPSVDRLSVTFADESLKSDRSDTTPRCVDRFRSQTAERSAGGNLEVFVMGDEAPSDDEDYSASVTAIIQRRASTRKSRKHGGRRGSSPFSPDILPEMENGRRISCITISSGDTGITMDDGIPSVTQEQIFENIKLHKEVLSSVKMQPWNMRKKLRLVMQAKSYIKKHEGALQERLAHSRSTRDMLARCNIYIVKEWQHLKREAVNLSKWFIPWELKIKEIESHFGSVVASYFIFLRWLFKVNLVISIILIAFVAVPELLTSDIKADPDRKSILPEDKYNSTNFLTLWDFEGVFKYSPMFYGWYTSKDNGKNGYRLPLAYFFTGLIVYVYSFVATLRKMAKNSRMSKLSEKEDECIFSWKLFTGWDYMIGNAETAHNRVASIVMSFKEALLEEAEKKREVRSWKIIGRRVLVNLGVLGLLVVSAFVVITVVARSNEKEANSTTWRRNETAVVLNLISLFFPILFEVLGFFEQYHPRKQLRLQLARIMVLNLLNLYSLIFALFDKINDMGSDLEAINMKLRNITAEATTVTTPIFNNAVEISTQSMIGTTVNLTNAIFTQIADNITTQISDFNDEISTESIIDTTVNLTNAIFTEIVDKITTQISDVNATASTDYFNFTAENREVTVNYLTEMFSENTNNSNMTISDLFLSVTADILNDTAQIREKVTSFINMFQENETNFNLAEVLERLNGTTLPYIGSSDYSSSSTDAEITTEVPMIGTYNSSSMNAVAAALSMLMDKISSNDKTPSDATIYADTTFSTFVTKISASELSSRVKSLNYTERSRLRSLCWETMFGQELAKVTVMDLVVNVFSTLLVDFFRGIFVRYMNNCWCWDLERKFPQYGDFKVAENILHLINNQGMVWMGMFFSPGLVVLNSFKLYMLMYLRSWTVLSCNVPHEVIFRASRSNNFYFALLLLMLFLCVLPVGYTIVWLNPSKHCGPFSKYYRTSISHIFTETIKKILPKSTHKILDYIASPCIVIPILMLLVLIIYYLISLTNALREANNDLKFQLRRERTEERRKVFQLADKRRRGGSDSTENPFNKWKKLLQGYPSGKSLDETPKQEAVAEKTHKNEKSRSRFPIFMQTVAKTHKPSVSDEESRNQAADDGTDTEQHDSLPDDSIREAKPQVPKLTRRNHENATGESGGDSRRVKINERFKKSSSRKDSINSNWSDNIPVITISKTESSECIIESKTVKINAAQKGDADAPRETKIKIDIEKNPDAPRIKYVLKKQVSEIEKDDDFKDDKSGAQKEFKKSGESTQTTDTTKTESSTDYKDSTFSN